MTRPSRYPGTHWLVVPATLVPLMAWAGADVAAGACTEARWWNCLGPAFFIHLSWLHLLTNGGGLLIAALVLNPRRRPIQLAVAWGAAAATALGAAALGGGSWVGASGLLAGALGYAWAAGGEAVDVASRRTWLWVAAVPLLLVWRTGWLVHALTFALGLAAPRLAKRG